MKWCPACCAAACLYLPGVMLRCFLLGTELFGWVGLWLPATPERCVLDVLARRDPCLEARRDRGLVLVQPQTCAPAHGLPTPVCVCAV